MANTIPKSTQPENMRLFIAALRSGRFQQGRGGLEVTDSKGVVRHCCLGVATRVAMENGIELETTEQVEPNGVFTEFRDPATRGTMSSLLYSVQRWLGIEKISGSANPGFSGGRNAIQLNDSERAGFHQIADAFEETYLTARSARDGGE